MLTSIIARGAEVIPPAPDHYFNDYTNTISASAGQAIDDKLAQFERDTSNQVWVVMYPTMQSDSSIEDYTIRVAEKWKVGQKKRDNGVVLFIFKNDHKMRIEVGYGLEGALPDITARQIMDNDIAPRFKANDYAGGINAGVDSIIGATKGEYKGLPQSNSAPQSPAFGIGVGIFILFALIVIGWLTNQGPFGLIWFILNALLSSGSQFGGRDGGGWSSGGGGGGGGGFSGGGGSFGGGGASGSW